MFTFETLDITGYRDTPLPHTFLKQKAEAHHLAILLPGVGYTVHMPLLYYPMLELLGRGVDVLRVETMYVKQPDYDALSPAEKALGAIADAAAAFRAALAQRPYEQVTLVGKSLGTMGMGYLLTTEESLKHAQTIWLTPLLWNDILRSQIKQAKPRSLFVAGDADPHYSAPHLSELQAVTHGAAVVVPGANHSLEIDGDVLASLQAIERAMRAVQEFLDQHQSATTTL